MYFKQFKRGFLYNSSIQFFWLFLLLFAIGSNAQDISGTVITDGEPLPGATILVKGTTIGAVTDFDGNFTLAASATSTLVVSYVGFVSKEVLVGNQRKITITLQQDNNLEEVVVIGYGTQRKSDLTGSVASVNANDLAGIPNSRVDQVLQGRAAGVQITQNSGAPGSGTSIRIRGGNSISSTNEPLWVVDGIIVGTDFDLNNINANDIKSIEILKDASSIAIYGTRGANGVVLVTTKNGANIGGGKTQVTFGTALSMQLVPERPEFLSQADQIAFTNESAEFRSAALPFTDAPNTYPNTDWFDLLLNTAPIHNYDVSVSGSSENGNVNYYNSLNYFDQEGIVKSSGLKKYIFRSNTDIKINEKFKTGFRINYSRLNRENGNASYGQALSILPTQTVRNPDGSFNGFDPISGGPFNNPIANIALNINETITNNLLATAYLEYRPGQNWIFRSTFNPEIDNVKRNRFFSSQSPNFLEVNETGRADVRTSSLLGWNNENTMQFQSDFGNHSLTALGGLSFQKVKTEIVESRTFGITSDATGFNNLAFGSDPTRNEIESFFRANQLMSLFGRINYDYKDKYLLTLVGRYDGSSRFAPGNKFNFFPSIAAAWKISEEPFMQDQSLFQSLKLRASYGAAGSQGIDPYRTRGILVEADTTLGGEKISGLAIGRPANPNLRWEITNQLDVSLEASLFNGRLFTEFNYYKKVTNDLLLDVSIPRQTGFSSQLQNIGSLENKGWEFLLNSKNINTDTFKWNSTVTLSSNKNKILDLGGVDFVDVVVDEILGAGNTRLIVGESVPSFTGVRYLGTWKSQEEIDASGLTSPQVVGGPRFEDLNGDGIISTEDNVVLGNPIPDLIFGLENSFSYKNLDFSFFFQGTVGNEVFNLRTRQAYFQRGETVKYAELINRWTPDNPTSNIPRAGADSVTEVPSNSEYVEDGSHVRLKNVRLTYNLPVEKFGFDSLKAMSVYFSGTNLLLFSDFRLIDPESNSFGGQELGNIAQGFSNGEYPNPRVLSLGLNVTF